jgi:hypothetical protein
MNCVREKVAAFRQSVSQCTGNADTDGDGIPDCIEPTVTRNPAVKDNDVFGVSNLFVMQQYRDFLGREADASGQAFWRGEIDGGRQTRQSMIEAFLTAGEFDQLTAPIARLYFGMYLRIPDYAGLAFWTDEFRSGRRNLVNIGNAFTTVPEFTNRYGNVSDNRAFVTLVYQNVLARAPDAAGADFWTNQLNTGLVRGDMLTRFTESAEYKTRRRGEILATLLYAGMLKRAPSDFEFNNVVNAIAGGQSVQSQITAILNSSEYRRRFLP